MSVRTRNVPRACYRSVEAVPRLVLGCRGHVWVCAVGRVGGWRADLHRSPGGGGQPREPALGHQEDLHGRCTLPKRVAGKRQLHTSEFLKVGFLLFFFCLFGSGIHQAAKHYGAGVWARGRRQGHRRSQSICGTLPTGETFTQQRAYNSLQADLIQSWTSVCRNWSLMIWSDTLSRSFSSSALWTHCWMKMSPMEASGASWAVWPTSWLQVRRKTRWRTSWCFFQCFFILDPFVIVMFVCMFGAETAESRCFNKFLSCCDPI